MLMNGATTFWETIEGQSAFGNAGSLLANPMQYDVFYIDMCKTPGVSAEAIVQQLQEKGVQGPLEKLVEKAGGAVCGRMAILAEGDSQKRGDISYLDKPIQADALSATIEHALSVKENAVPHIEIREDNKTTHYITEPDILYAVQDGMFVDIFLKDGKTLHILDNPLNLFEQWENFPSFLMPSSKTVINGRYIKALRFRKAVMTDGRVFPVAGDCLAYAKKVFQEYNAQK
mgnify:CR=1 FL=1